MGGTGDTCQQAISLALGSTLATADVRWHAGRLLQPRRLRLPLSGPRRTRPHVQRHGASLGTGHGHGVERFPRPLVSATTPLRTATGSSARRALNAGEFGDTETLTLDNTGQCAPHLSRRRRLARRHDERLLLGDSLDGRHHRTGRHLRERRGAPHDRTRRSRDRRSPATPTPTPLARGAGRSRDPTGLRRDGRSGRGAHGEGDATTGLFDVVMNLIEGPASNCTSTSTCTATADFGTPFIGLPNEALYWPNTGTLPKTYFLNVGVQGFSADERGLHARGPALRPSRSERSARRRFPSPRRA
jgi:hypothetical protein